MKNNLPNEIILGKIYLVRGHKILLDRDLAELYQVETKQLKRQVRRNIERFPDDFMFELSNEELENLRCQIGTSSWGGVRYMPMAFTEQGVAMLSSVLNSATAIEVNIQIVRVFTKMREMLLTNQELLIKISELENRADLQDDRMDQIFQYIRSMIRENREPSQLGYKTNRRS